MVDQLYLDLLHRPTDPAGLDFWASQAGDASGRASVACQIARTPEGRRRFVADLYPWALGRPADAAGLSYWSGRLAGGTSESAVIAGVFGSSELVARAGGSPEAFVDALYPALLGRAADAGGRAYWVSRLGAGTSPIQVALAFATGTEGLGVRAALVYQQMLGRAPAAPACRRGGDHLLRR